MPASAARPTRTHTPPMGATRSVVVVAAVLVLAALTGCTHSSGGRAPRSSPGAGSVGRSATAAIAPVTRWEAAALAAALSSRDAARASRAIAPIAHLTRAEAASLVPVGTHLMITGPATGTSTTALLPVTLTGTSHGNWLLLLVRVNGHWLALLR